MTGIFTLDAVVALAMATVILSASLVMFSEPKSSSREYLYQVSTDLLAILDENGGLKKLAAGDSTGLQELEAVIPQRFCLEIDVLNSTDEVVYRAESSCPAGGEYSISRRSFVKDDAYYLAEARVWFK